MDAPEVAFRDCSDCKMYLYHEKGDHAGEPLRDRQNRKVRRSEKQKPPCELSGCKKGHWKDPIEMTRDQEMAVTLFLATQATAGRNLNPREAACPLVQHVHMILQQLFRSLEQAQAAQRLAMSIVLAGNKREGGSVSKDQ